MAARLLLSRLIRHRRREFPAERSGHRSTRANGDLRRESRVAVLTKSKSIAIAYSFPVATSCSYGTGAAGTDTDATARRGPAG